jgi:hypothetical protein
VTSCRQVTDKHPTSHPSQDLSQKNFLGVCTKEKIQGGGGMRSPDLGRVGGGPGPEKKKFDTPIEWPKMVTLASFFVTNLTLAPNTSAWGLPFGFLLPTMPPPCHPPSPSPQMQVCGGFLSVFLPPTMPPTPPLSPTFTLAPNVSAWGFLLLLFFHC